MAAPQKLHKVAAAPEVGQVAGYEGRAKPIHRDNHPRTMIPKLALRLAVIDGLGGKAKVFDAFAGAGRLWRAVGRHYPDVTVTGVDQRRYRRSIKADNRRVIEGIDLERFDVVDLDSYGVPVEQARMLSDRGWNGTLVWTCICTAFGHLPTEILVAEGIPAEWREISPQLFSGRDPDELRDRWCGHLCRLGWRHHAALVDNRTMTTALHGVSTDGTLPVTRDSVKSAILRVYERHEDQVGEQLVEPDVGMLENL